MIKLQSDVIVTWQELVNLQRRLLRKIIGDAPVFNQFFLKCQKPILSLWPESFIKT
jgi:hypothetical protein